MTSQYAMGELARAFTTAGTHEDAATRARADARANAWVRTIDAMARGDVQVGSRTPVAGLPAWVTPEVLRGGFATGSAVAGGPLEPDELASATRLAIEPRRDVLFAYFLGEQGLAELHSLLDTGNFRVEVPEDAALLVVAWLARHDRAAALEVIDALAPLAGTLRLMPRRATAAGAPSDHVHRLAVGEARDVLRSRRRNERIETQREALVVWNPFADKMLALWAGRAEDGRIDLAVDADWRARATGLLGQYRRLAAAHTRCAKHRNPKSNLAILLAAAEDVLADGTIDARRCGMLATVIRSMISKRGTPGSLQQGGLRAEQARVASLPAHSAVAELAAKRLEGRDSRKGIVEPVQFATPVTAGEETADIPAGTPMPPVVARVLDRTWSAPIEALISHGIVSSSEVLAELVPALSASVMSEAYRDTSLARVMAANYRAFRHRRSLLLVDLSRQVQLNELPWVRATLPHRSADTDDALALVRRVGSLALDNFPQTIVPNPLVVELDALLSESNHDVPLTEEIAADIFTGYLTPKFPRAASLAHDLLAGTLYARYYDLPSPSAYATPRRRPLRRRRKPPSRDTPFSALCRKRAGAAERARRWVAQNGTVLEQAQILTTHNLAALVTAGAVPTRAWVDLADAAVEGMIDDLGRVPDLERPLSTIKNAAYAWRQAIFYLSMSPPDAVVPWVRGIRERHADSELLGQVLGGLAHVAGGGSFDAAGKCPGGQRFLGWTTGRHWVLGPEPRNADVRTS